MISTKKAKPHPNHSQKKLRAQLQKLKATIQEKEQQICALLAESSSQKERDRALHKQLQNDLRSRDSRILMLETTVGEYKDRLAALLEHVRNREQHAPKAQAKTHNPLDLQIESAYQIELAESAGVKPKVDATTRELEAKVEAVQAMARTKLGQYEQKLILAAKQIQQSEFKMAKMSRSFREQLARQEQAFKQQFKHLADAYNREAHKLASLQTVITNARNVQVPGEPRVSSESVECRAQIADFLLQRERLCHAQLRAMVEDVSRCIKQKM